MNVQELPNGDLEINAEGEPPEDEGEVTEYLNSIGYHSLPPENIGALTSAPIFTDDSVLAGLGDPGEKPDPDAKVWWFPDYALRLMSDDLRENGRLILKRAEEMA